MKNYTTWQNQCPLRFIEREGKKILQSPWVCMESGEIEWKDVPLEVEKEVNPPQAGE